MHEPTFISSLISATCRCSCATCALYRATASPACCGGVAAAGACSGAAAEHAQHTLLHLAHMLQALRPHDSRTCIRLEFMNVVCHGPRHRPTLDVALTVLFKAAQCLPLEDAAWHFAIIDPLQFDKDASLEAFVSRWVCFVRDLAALAPWVQHATIVDYPYKSGKPVAAALTAMHGALQAMRSPLRLQVQTR